MTRKPRKVVKSRPASPEPDLPPAETPQPIKTYTTTYEQRLTMYFEEKFIKLHDKINRLIHKVEKIEKTIDNMEWEIWRK